MNTSKAIAGTPIVCGILFSTPLTILLRRADTAEAAALAAQESMQRATDRVAGRTAASAAPQLGDTPEAGDAKFPGAVSRDAAPEKFEALYRRSAALSPEAYGKRYAELLAGTSTADTNLERAAMLAAVNGDRAVAAYVAYKKQTGSAFGRHNSELESLLTLGGQRDGAKMMAALQKAAPDCKEIASLTHGWAMADPRAAVDWFNSMPDD